MRELTEEILRGILIPIIPLISIFIITWFRVQTAKLRKQMELEEINNYLDIVDGLIEGIVRSVNQTFVDNLKREGAFTKEKQLEAFNLAKEQILGLIKEDGIVLLNKVYEDYEKFIESKIEEMVNVIKI